MHKFWGAIKRTQVITTYIYLEPKWPPFWLEKAFF